MPKSPSPIPEESVFEEHLNNQIHSDDACSEITDTSSDYLSDSDEEASDDEGDLAGNEPETPGFTSGSEAWPSAALTSSASRSEKPRSSSAAEPRGSAVGSPHGAGVGESEPRVGSILLPEDQLAAYQEHNRSLLERIKKLKDGNRDDHRKDSHQMSAHDTSNASSKQYMHDHARANALSLKYFCTCERAHDYKIRTLRCTPSCACVHIVVCSCLLKMSAAVRRGAATSMEGEKNLGGAATSMEGEKNLGEVSSHLASSHKCEEAYPPSDGVILDKCSFSADQSAAVIYH